MPARARRRTASLEFLDSDIVAEAGLLAAHARWHHGVSDALTLGFCPCVSVDGQRPAVTGVAAPASPEWLPARTPKPRNAMAMVTSP